MQRLNPFVIAPVIVLVTSGVAYGFFLYLETVSPSGAANNPQALTSPTAQATSKENSQTTAVPVSKPSATPTPPPLRLGRPQFSLFTINPKFTKQQVSFTLSAPAMVRVQIAPQGQTTPVRTMDMDRQPAGTVRIQWDGRDDAGNLVPAKTYSYTITATDEAGTQQTQTQNGLGITYKRIVVSLSQQRLTAYDSDKQAMTTLVTTGNPALPTPVGNFPILDKQSPFTFTSSRPTGDKYYYPPAQASYALLFDNRGYYIHDAPWRRVFGPGTNAKAGKPGQNYTGSHGCVNVPLAAEKKLYEWATIGTVVQVMR